MEWIWTFCGNFDKVRTKRDLVLWLSGGVFGGMMASFVWLAFIAVVK